jgi:hypothetical protein
MPKVFLVIALVFTVPALAQGSLQQGATPAQRQNQNAFGSGARPPVATQPSNNPFANPISQGVPPAASSNSVRNNGRTNVPLGR